MNRALEQWFTPEWAAIELVSHYFRDLTLCDRVVEPSCGEGAFLRAIPDHVPAIGIEIDHALAVQARAGGREVLIGDFREVALPFVPTAVIGNPPFRLARAFLARAWELLPHEGRVGFILPASFFQTAGHLVRLAKDWHIEQDMIPRNVFPRMQSHLCFARFTKGRIGTVGFFLYREVHEVSHLRKRYRALLAQGERSVWAAVVRAALELAGGCADLKTLYREIGGCRPTGNAFWRDKVRQTVQRVAVRRGRGEWALPALRAAA